MATTFKLDSDEFVKALSAAIDVQVKKVFEEVIEKAKQELDQTLRGELAKIVMSLHRDYEVYSRDNRLVITVLNDGKFK